jgi:hypothetical protein
MPHDDKETSSSWSPTTIRMHRYVVYKERTGCSAAKLGAIALSMNRNCFHPVTRSLSIPTSHGERHVHQQATKDQRSRRWLFSLEPGTLARKKDAQHTAAGIPTWSPTVVLICRSTAYVWQSGRDAQFSADCGRMCLLCKDLIICSSSIICRTARNLPW